MCGCGKDDFTFQCLTPLFRLSRRTGVNLANNTQTTYEYDNVNRLLNLANKINGGADISTFGYTYDKVGNRLTKDETRGTNDAGMHNYGYDKIYQLTNVDYPDGYGFEDTAFDYDALGNRETVTQGTGASSYTSNNLNQYTSVDTAALTYGLNGNLTTANGWTYTYDYENRLTGVTNGIVTADYKYDAFGRRISKEVLDSNRSTLSAERYLYDGDAILAEYDSSGNLLRKYIHSDSIDEAVAMAAGSNTYFYNRDGLGSNIELTDNTGAVVEKYSYDVYGKTVIKDAADNVLIASAIGNRYGFTGRELDFETGNYFYRARYYSPTLGRFLQTDPVGYYDDINLYRYCSNNPIIFIDPWGLQQIELPMPVPGGEPGSGWKWNPNPQNSRGGTWGPKEPVSGQSQPSASWDPEGHWDVDDGKGNRQRYDENGKPISAEEVHNKCKEPQKESDPEPQTGQENNAKIVGTALGAAAIATAATYGASQISIGGGTYAGGGSGAYYGGATGGIGGGYGGSIGHAELCAGDNDCNGLQW